MNGIDLMMVGKRFCILLWIIAANVGRAPASCSKKLPCGMIQCPYKSDRIVTYTSPFCACHVAVKSNLRVGLPKS